MLTEWKERRQFQHRFNLDLNKEDEHQLHEIIWALKKKRQFMGVIRDGIRLILDLRQGQTGVLRELFPWVFEQNSSALESQLEELKLLISQRPLVPAAVPQPMSARNAGFDNDEDTVIIEEKIIGEDFNPDWNLSVKIALMVGNLAGLSPEMIWYGIRTGLINAQTALDKGSLSQEIIAQGVKAGKLDKAKLPKDVVKEAERLPDNGGPKEIAGADIGLSEPVFDDIELDF